MAVNVNLKLYKKAKTEFEKSFSLYSSLMYKLNGTVHEQPQLYYSESIAKKGLPQQQTKYYLKEAEKIKLRIKKAKIAAGKKYSVKQKKKRMLVKKSTAF